MLLRVLNIFYKGTVTARSMDVRKRIQAAFREYDWLLTMVKRQEQRSLRSSGLTKTNSQGAANGIRRSR